MRDDHLKKYRHAPAHLFLSVYWYFVTGGTYGRKKHFETEWDRQLLLDAITEMLLRASSELHGWVILSNHYHVLMKLKDAILLPGIIRGIHSKSAVLLNKRHLQPGRRIWYQYWDECVRDERDFYAKLNYIHLNPIKHGYVDEPGSYRFSSYNSYRRMRGESWLEDLLKRFPAGDIDRDSDF